MNAAFFDIDGTLLAKPSLERRLLGDLWWRRGIPASNYFRWLAEAVRLSVRDPRIAVQGNKVYLRGLAADAFASATHGRRSTGAIEFFPAAVQRVWWHAMRGDRIVLVSGTLEPLAEKVKFALEREMLWRGVDVNVAVLATRPEIRDGRFTGRVLGAPMFGEEKARAVREFAELHGIMLSQCSSYGDSSLDRWMLSAVGHPVAVNADGDLKKVAGLRGWPAVAWKADRRSAREVRAVIIGWKGADWKRRSETAR